MVIMSSKFKVEHDVEKCCHDPKKEQNEKNIILFHFFLCSIFCDSASIECCTSKDDIENDDERINAPHRKSWSSVYVLIKYFKCSGMD